MPHQERQAPHTQPYVRATLQFGICLLLVFVFVMTATATVAPLGPAASVTPSRTPSASRTALSAGRRTSTPTLTPTPRQSLSKAPVRSLAPQLIPGQPTPDPHTVALYHFDDTSTANVDATGRYTATLYGNASIAPNSLYGGSLQLDGNGSYVSTGYLGQLDQGTVEAYVDFDLVCNNGTGKRPIVAIRNASGQDVLWLGVDYDEWLRVYIYENGNSHLASSGINACKYLTGDSADRWPYETWRFHHVAVTWGPRGEEIWVDGVLHGVGNDLEVDTHFLFICNPQMQLGTGGWPSNDLYPVCKTPVMAPTMPSYPHGDYTGPLPPYNTIRIGCDSGGVCSVARIDEVRISDVQRTFTWTVDPTVTPTPTWTPINPSGAYSPDAYTLALYHLDSFVAGTWTLEEASQTYHVALGNVSIVPGRFNSALNLGGQGSYLNLGRIGSEQGTVEAWVDFTDSKASQPIFTGSYSAMFFGALANQNIELEAGGLSNVVTTNVTPGALSNCWHHLAGTWGLRGLEVWLDGRVIAAVPTNHATVPAQDWRLGCDTSGNCMQGTVDEVRISSIQRIFSPLSKRPVRASPFAVTRGSAAKGSLNSGSDFNLFLPFVALAAGPTPIPCY